MPLGPASGVYVVPLNETCVIVMTVSVTVAFWPGDRMPVFGWTVPFTSFIVKEWSMTVSLLWNVTTS